MDKDVTERKSIVIVALRRSGTTAVWRVFRTVPGYTCIDEPFRTDLSHLPKENRKKTNTELARIYRRDPDAFDCKFAPIDREDELSCTLSRSQREYLKFLMDKGPVVLDETRLLRKLEDAESVLNGTLVVHLFRRPIPFASSHLVPSQSGDVLGARKAYRIATLFRRKKSFDNWGMESLVRGRPAGVAREFMSEEGVDVGSASQSAAAQLLGMWLASYRYFERIGRAYFRDNFLSVNYEEFCRNPDWHMKKIAEAANADLGQWDQSQLRTSGVGFRVNDQRWLRMCRSVGFTDREMQLVDASGRK